jgi:hypothetical protein
VAGIRACAEAKAAAARPRQVVDRGRRGAPKPGDDGLGPDAQGALSRLSCGRS